MMLYLKHKKRLKVGRSLSLFYNGFQKRDEIRGRKVWRIPVMEGKFVIVESFRAVQAAAGGTLILMGDGQKPYARMLKGLSHLFLVGSADLDPKWAPLDIT